MPLSIQLCARPDALRRILRDAATKRVAARREAEIAYAAAPTLAAHRAMRVARCTELRAWRRVEMVEAAS